MTVLQNHYDTPFAPVLSTNHVPTAEEMLGIRAALEKPTTSLRHLDQKISVLQAARVQLSSFIDEHLYLLSPIRRACPEILATIFLYCTSQEHFPQYEPATRNVPLVLASVCRSWRNVALNTPRLWSEIQPHLPAPRHPPIDDLFRNVIHGREQRLKQWLSRSGCVPLVLTLHVAAPWTTGYETQWDDHGLEELEQLHLHVASLLLPCYPRLKSVTLYAPSYIREMLGNIQHVQLTTLHAFQLISHSQTRTFDPQQAKEHPLDVFLKSPSLRILLLHEPYHHAPVQWENLTHLDIPPNYRYDIPTPTVVHILSRASSSLQECSIAISLTPNDTQWPPSIFPHLHTLHLHFILDPYTASPPLLFPQLRAFGESMAPTKLKHLTIDVAGNIAGRYLFEPLPSWPFPSLVGPGCELETLGFNVNITGNAIIALLRDQPSITNLAVDPRWEESQSFTDIIHALTPSTAAPVCPHLTQLKVHLWGDSKLEEDIILLARRRAGCDPPESTADITPLQYLCVASQYPQPDAQFSRRLQPLRDQGMTVRWTAVCETRMYRSGYSYIPKPEIEEINKQF